MLWVGTGEVGVKCVLNDPPLYNIIFRGWANTAGFGRKRFGNVPRRGEGMKQPRSHARSRNIESSMFSCADIAGTVQGGCGLFAALAQDNKRRNKA